MGDSDLANAEPRPDRLAVLESRTRYAPAAVETEVFARWDRAGIFDAEPEGSPEANYSIAIPPPNVTGALHMGHALNGTIQDVLVRLRRMRGERVKWIFGTDHAGIATQAQVEKLLAIEGSGREEIGRAAFEQRVWEWRAKYGATIVEQFKRLGASCDYGDEHFTMDDAYARAVARVFCELYKKGLIYRDHYMVNWDPGTRSAISDLEVEDREVEGAIYTIAYPLASGDGELAIATTRPETLLADTAVAVNPNDERYQRLVGEAVTLPIVGRRISIIADDHVDPEFGTGALKITPGHDPNDFEIGRKHGLDEITVIDEEGRMNDLAGEFAGMTVLAARDAVVERLRRDGALLDVKPHTHVVPHSHRSGERIEPLISLQWFCRMDELAGPAIAAVESGEVRFHPDRWSRVYLNWMHEIRPWCISRQLWWGHRLPVWYRGEDEVYVGEVEPEGEGWTRDEDVLDTWFSSALWPFATLGWPEETPELSAFYPTDVLSTARDIIFLWVARMIMMGIEFTGRSPFADVYIHSVIQAPDGRRMSKSLGTGIDPLEAIDEYGVDALRFGLLAMSSSQDVRYSVEKVGQGQDLANKLWNAARLILLKVDDVRPEPRAETIEDRWILSRLQHATKNAEESIAAYDFAHASLGLYDFFYRELCDWYLELVKPRLWDENADRSAVSATLLHVLSRTLALLHPLMPFVTEEIWSLMPGGDRRLLAVTPFPTADEALIDIDAERQVDRLVDAVTALRRCRDEIGVAPAARPRCDFAATGYDGLLDQIARLARFEPGSVDDGEPAATVVVPGGVVRVFAAEEVDPHEARRQVDRRRTKLEQEIARARGKLANEGFVTKAPPAVVEAERTRLGEFERELAELIA